MIQLTSDVTPRPVDSGISGHYEPNFPGATSLRDARALWIDGEPVTAEVHGRNVLIYAGCKVLSRGTLPEEITERWQVNPWVAQRALATAN